MLPCNQVLWGTRGRQAGARQLWRVGQLFGRGGPRICMEEAGWSGCKQDLVPYCLHSAQAWLTYSPAKPPCIKCLG